MRLAAIPSFGPHLSHVLALTLVTAIAGGCGDDDSMSDAMVDAMDAGVDSDMMDGGVDSGAPDTGTEDADPPDTTPDGDVPDMDMPDMGMPDMCEDLRRNGDETDTDCGGETCEARCPDGDRCLVSPDCESGVCISGLCQPPRCEDGIRNGTETGVDCGGDCAGCRLGEGCVEEDDCDSTGECADGFCQAAHCFDESRNADETDVDCGGDDCAPCAAGLRCAAASDCSSGSCVGGFCLVETCLNDELDPGEVDVDCGGGMCPGCVDGTECTEGGQCLSDRCEGEDPSICTSCMDEVQNGAEIGVDCGGGVCAGCAIGAECVMNRDCGSNACEDGECVPGARSCLEIRVSDPELPSGVYEVQPDPELPAVRVYCDMDTDGGGWTMVVSSNAPVDDYGVGPYDDLSSLRPLSANAAIWNGMRGLELDSSDVRFACKRDAADADYNVDMSFYNNDWYQVLTAGDTDEDVCFLTAFDDIRNGTENPERRDNIAERTLVLGTPYMSFDVDLDAEGDCEDEDDFNIDFEAGGIFNDGDNDWGEDGGDEFCGSGGALTDGAWFMFFREALCFNERLDAGEVGVDCGGSCRGCPDATECTMNVDCASERCDDGICTSCRDGVLNGDETAIDCGGSCGPCPGGTPCTMDSDCASGSCEALVCTDVDIFYEEDFEDGDGLWVAGGANSSWAYGMPAGDVITGAASGTGAWVTNLTGDYNNSEESFITSPSIDLSAARVDPVISLSLNYETESCCDEGYVEVSIDGGDTWTVVSPSPAAQNWYNDLANDWWDGAGTGGAWVTAGTTLAGTAGESDVRVRVHFSSDTSALREGFGIDDVRILPAAPDLAVEVLPSPELCGNASVRVTNLGFATVTRFTLTTTVDGGTPDVEMVVGALDPGDSIVRNFAATDMVSATVSADGDSDASNDSGSVMVAGVLSGRYIETFESGAGGWQATGTNSSWALGRPTDFEISGADSGVNAWVTNLSANYNNDESSFLVSPCFDLSGAATDPTFTFSSMFRLPATGDHAFVELTVDGGMTWTKLGAAGDSEFWYNDETDNWWDGDSSTGSGVYRRASHPLDGAAGNAAVRVRFVFESNASGTDEGFALDDVALLP